MKLFAFKHMLAQHFLLSCCAVFTAVSAAQALPAPVSAGLTREMPAMPETRAESRTETKPSVYVPVTEKSRPGALITAGAVARADVPQAATVSTVPVKVLYVQENQPVQIVDSQGRLIQVIYLRKSGSHK